MRITSYTAAVKKDVPFTVAGAEGDEHDVGTEAASMEAASVDIVLENKHEQAGLINKIDVTVHDANNFTSCEGGGPLTASAEYDFRIPTDEDVTGRTFSRTELYSVAGKSTERMLVPIGPDHIAEQQWGWAYTVSITLHLQSGGSVSTGKVTLMDGGTLPYVTSLTTRPDSPAVDLDCVRAHRDAIDKFATSTNPHSEVIGSLQRVLHDLDL